MLEAKDEGAGLGSQNRIKTEASNEQNIEKSNEEIWWRDW